MRIIFIIFLVLFVACGRTKHSEDSSKDCLPDSLFVARNLTESMSIFEVQREESGRRCYFKSKELKVIDSVNVIKFVSLLYKDVTPSGWIANFVAKQERIGEFQPIIVRLEEYQYMALWYIVLDKNCNPTSFLYLDKCFDEEGFETDSTILHCPTRKNFFKKDHIESYEIRETNYKNSGLTMVDSVTYMTTIDSKGILNSKRLDSTRLTKQWRR